MGLVKDLGLEQVKDGLGSIGTQLLHPRSACSSRRCGWRHLLTVCLKVASQHAIIFSLELGE